jgi:hypothetical protein
VFQGVATGSAISASLPRETRISSSSRSNPRSSSSDPFVAGSPAPGPIASISIASKSHSVSVPSSVGDPSPNASPSASSASSAALRKSLGDASLAKRVLEAASDQSILADRDRHNIDELAAGDPGMPLIEVPELNYEIHDIEGLQALGRHLFG